MTMINMFYPMTSPIYVTITYSRNKGVPTGFPLTFPNIVFQDTFLQIPICLMMWINGRKLYSQPRNQGV